jgi:transposase
VARHELSDEAWERIEGLLPEDSKLGGRPWNDHRRTLNGIFWVLRTGAPWRDLPACFGAWKSVYGRFNRWSKAGMIDRIVETLYGMLAAAGKIDRELWCVDGSSVRAQHAAAGGGKRGARTSLRTTPSVALAAAGGPSSIWSATGRARRSRSS